MDYFLADDVAVPIEGETHFREQVVRLPSIVPYLTPNAEEPTALPCIANGYITFGSFNRIQKVTPSTLRTWAAILRSVDSARLVIKGAGLQTSRVRDRISGSLSENGVHPSRVDLIGTTGQAEHLRSYSQIDLSLDPSPHGGGISALESLWMGVPVLTAPSEAIQSRLAASFLTTLGLTDFIARDSREMIHLAVQWSQRETELAKLRGNLRSRLQASIICDVPAYTRSVEAAYRTLWHTWLQSV